MPDISNHDDTIDSRDVIARIEELQEERVAFEYDEDGNRTEADWSEANPSDAAELAELLALAEDASAADDWDHGVTLVRDSYFTSYVQQLLEDIGDLPRDLPSYIEIDWYATARNIQQDYFSVAFGSVTYWVR